MQLLATVKADAEGLAVPKYEGRIMDVADFMLAWCEANGFTVE